MLATSVHAGDSSSEGLVNDQTQADEAGHDDDREQDATPPRPVGHARLAPSPRPPSEPGIRPGSWMEAFVATVDEGHNREAWTEHEAMRFRMKKKQPDESGETVFKARGLYELKTGRLRLELENGAVLISAGGKAWLSPAEADFDRARFHAMTLPYLLGMPMRLHDPQNYLIARGFRRMEDGQWHVGQVVFDRDPDQIRRHWYVIFLPPRTHLIETITFFHDAGQEDVHPDWQQQYAARFRDYKPVNGVPIAHRWDIHNWHRARGVDDDPIAVIELDEITFTDLPEAAFGISENARRLDPPPPPEPADDEEEGNV